MSVHEVVYMRYKMKIQVQEVDLVKNLFRAKSHWEKSCGREKSIAKNRLKVRHSHPLEVRALKRMNQEVRCYGRFGVSAGQVLLRASDAIRLIRP